MSAPLRNVGCELTFDFLKPSALGLQVAPVTVLDEELSITGADLDSVSVGPHGQRTHILRGGAGRVEVRYRAATAPIAEAVPVGSFDEEVLVARRQSRYCPSDEMAEFAARELEDALELPDLADRVASWVFERTAYDGSVSRSSDTAVDTLLAGRGVCRDFAHLTIAMCRALGIPARLVSVYAPGIDPMDFHAVAEVWRDDRWDVIDATRMAPRSTLVRIATGRDAADTAFAATIIGDVQLLRSEVFAVVDGSLPPDDHVTPTALA